MLVVCPHTKTGEGVFFVALGAFGQTVRLLGDLLLQGLHGVVVL